MKLELHKAYKTRGGWKAVVVDVNEIDDFVVWHEEDNKTSPHCSASGEAYKGGDYNIVEEWHEPRHWKVWVEVEQHAEGVSLTAFTEQPRVLGATKAIAGPFTITEGEGL